MRDRRGHRQRARPRLGSHDDAAHGRPAHRGPDGSGFAYVRERWAAVGHRRLSIIDLVTGDQPISNEDGCVVVVYNRELYNFPGLRRELMARGHDFRTQSDTELLVHGWEEWGEDLLPRLNGMYAFALFDSRRDPAQLTPVDQWAREFVQRDALPFLAGPDAMLPHFIRGEWLRGFLD